MTALQRISAAIDRLNDRIGSAIQWLALVMVVIGAFNAIARYTDQYTGMSLSSNAYLDLQWYFFSLIFLMGSAYGLNHDYHVRVDVMYARLGRRARAWIDLTGSVLFLVPFAVLMFWISWGWVVRSWTILETSADPGGLPRYPIKSVVLVSFLLLLLQALSQIVKNAAILAEPVRGSARADGTGSPTETV
ncbi:MAG: TRAP transporter small permease subunit [Gemmatimonadota bacterium]|nr:TRAP transporter small permease subunit [Gemmatimonadota bacterium]